MATRGWKAASVNQEEARLIQLFGYLGPATALKPGERERVLVYRKDG
jgi:hypothetical protein